MTIIGTRLKILSNAFSDAFSSKEALGYPFGLILDFFSHRLSIDTHFADNIRKSHRQKFFNGNHWDFNGIKLPRMDDHDDHLLSQVIFDESIFPFVYKNNTFHEDMFYKYDRVFYGYQGRSLDITVQLGDVVFDVGSWAGDFAAYASVCGASSVYAFEPTPKTFEYLIKTAELNKNIIPVNLALGEEAGELPIYNNNNYENTGGNHLIKNESTQEEFIGTVKISTVDDYVSDHKIDKVDFIKSDIEGFERYMLKGARGVLKEFAPKLAICTYHLPDDPEVLEGIIKDANPNYKVIHMPHILFAKAK